MSTQNDLVQKNPKGGVKYVTYEVQMICKCLHYITRNEAAAEEEEKKKNKEYHKDLESMFIESCLIHCRAVYYFLFMLEINDPTKQDDILAKHYFDDPPSHWNESLKTGHSEKQCPKLSGEMTRLNKSLGHLTYTRSKYEDNKKWEIGLLSIEILNAFKKFVGELTDDRGGWFQKALTTIQQRQSDPSMDWASISAKTGDSTSSTHGVKF